MNAAISRLDQAMAQLAVARRTGASHPSYVAADRIDRTLPRAQYTPDELREMRKQAVFFPADVPCPRHDDRMGVVRTLAHQSSGRTVTDRSFEHWPAPPGWEPHAVELVCEACGLNVPAKTGSTLQNVWRRAVELVREGVESRGRDSIVVGTDERFLKVTFELPHTREEKHAVYLTVEHLTQSPVKLGQSILEEYDQNAASQGNP